MKNRIGLWRWGLLLLGVFIFLWQREVDTSAQQTLTGSVVVNVPQEAADAGLELTLYQVAVFDGSGYSLTEAFAESGVDLDNLNSASSTQTEAEALAAYAAAREIAGQTATADENGRVSFVSLKQGFYLVAQTAGADAWVIQAALVPVPYSGEDGWVYDAKITLKGSAVPEEETPEEETPSEETPEEESPQETEKSSGAKTGDTQYIMAWLLLAVLAAALLIWVTGRKKED